MNYRITKTARSDAHELHRTVKALPRQVLKNDSTSSNYSPGLGRKAKRVLERIPAQLKRTGVGTQNSPHLGQRRMDPTVGSKMGFPEEGLKCGPTDVVSSCINVHSASHPENRTRLLMDTSGQRENP